MTDFVIIAILVFVIGIAIAYIIKEKKKGVKCIGCPSAGKCARQKCLLKNKCGSSKVN